MTIYPEHPIGAPVRASEPKLSDWERIALAKLRQLRKLGKPAILYMTENGAIQVYQGERAGTIPP